MVRQKTVAFDIETLERLNVVPLPPITCICMYEDETKQQHKLRFWKLPLEEYESNKNIVINSLDKADCIVGYNAVLFDLEFIKQSFGISNEKMTRWVCKTTDMFMLCKYILKSTCKLDTLLTMNKLSNKSGSGKNAIVLANESKWEDLLDYCMDDTMLTYSLFLNCTSIKVSDVTEIQWNIFCQGQKFPIIQWRKSNNSYDLDSHNLNIVHDFPTIEIPEVMEQAYID